MRPSGPGSRRSRLLAGTTVALAIALHAPAAEPVAPPPSGPVPSVPFSVVDLFQTHDAAVVRVNMVTEELDETGKPSRSVTTGFFITKEGRILTSLLGSTRVSRVWVEKDGLDYAAQYLGGDSRSKIALIQMLRMPDDYTVIPLDGGNDLLAIGTSLLGITQPFGLEVGPTPGVVTGYESAYSENVFPCSYMRTNIALGPGEAGAPALDTRGRLAGILVAGVAEFRASYAVTVSSLRRIVDELSLNGRVNYGTLPVEFSEALDALYVARQVVISKVTPGSLAERAGLRPGDVVRRLALVTDRKVELPAMLARTGDAPIRRIAEVREILFHALPGEFMRIEVEREGRAIPFFTLPVEALPEEAASQPTDTPATNGSAKEG